MVGVCIARIALMLRPTGWWLAVAPVDCAAGWIDCWWRCSLSCVAMDSTVQRMSSATSRARIKIVCADAQGVWLCVRRLHRGSFAWPRVDEAVCTLSTEQFDWLVTGVDWRLLSARIEDVPRVM